MIATATTDYARVLEFIRRLASEGESDPQRRDAQLSALMHGLNAASGDAESMLAGFQVFASGWPELEGVMTLQPEHDSDAELQ